MQTAEEQLRFVVKFVGMDLEHLRPGDLLNLREELQEFLSARLGHDPVGTVVYPMPSASGEAPPLPAEYSARDFHLLQEDVRDVLSTLACMRQEGRRTTIDIQRHRDVVIHCLLGDGLAPGEKRIIIGGSARMVFLWKLSFLLAHKEARYIRQCPECQTIFYAERNQVYCTRRCVNRVNKRTWRAAKQQAEKTTLVGTPS